MRVDVAAAAAAVETVRSKRTKKPVAAESMSSSCSAHDVDDEYSILLRL